MKIVGMVVISFGILSFAIVAGLGIIALINSDANAFYEDLETYESLVISNGSEAWAIHVVNDDNEIRVEGGDIEVMFKRMFYSIMGIYDPNEHLMNAKLVFDEPKCDHARGRGMIEDCTLKCADCGKEF